MIFDDFDSFANAGNVVGSSQTFRGFENTTSTFSNSGTFNLTTGGMSLDDLLTIDNSGTLGVSGGNLTIGSNVGSYGTFNNSGAITSAAGRTVTFRGGIYNHNPGATITGGDYLSFNSTTLNLNTDFTTDFAATGMASSTVNGPGTYTNAAGTSMSLSETTLNTAVVNNGIMNQDVVNDVRNNWFNNGFTNHTGAEYLVLTRSSATTQNGHGYLNVDGDLDNLGTFALQSSRNYSYRTANSYLNQTNGTFTNHAGGLLESRFSTTSTTGSSYVRVDNLVNHGTIANNNTQRFSFDRSDAAYLNQGLVLAAVGDVAFTNFASFENGVGGILNASGGNIYLDGDAFTNQGTMTGDGSFIFSGGAQLVNEGMISPGESPGTLSVSGSGTFANSSGLLIEIGGNLQGTEYDFLTFSGTAALDGMLMIDLINGFTPQQSDVFTFLSASSITGSFDNAISQVFFAEGSFDVNYTSNLVTLSNFSSVPEPSTLFYFLSSVGLMTIRRRRV